MTHTYIKTAWQSLLRSLMRSVRRRAATSKRANRKLSAEILSFFILPSYRISQTPFQNNFRFADQPEVGQITQYKGVWT